MNFFVQVFLCVRSCICVMLWFSETRLYIVQTGLDLPPPEHRAYRHLRLFLPLWDF